MLPTLTTLLHRYNRPGPRYTSYPTVPAWTETVTAADYGKALQRLDQEDRLSLYFHIPFCEKLCHFCGCIKVITPDHSRSAKYVELLLEELNYVSDLLPDWTRSVSQIQFGGGTPNFLQPEELTAIMGAVRRHFEILSAAEIAIEMHPRTSTQAFCDNLKHLGFNRISLGVQDFDPTVQKLIHRFQTYEMTERMVTYLRELGFDSFNFDLIYGLPGQTLETWQKTLQQVLELRPNRLAVYSYAHVPWKAPVQRSFKDADLPPPALKLALFEQAYKTFTANGYRLIGMDHFALMDDELSQAAANGTLHRNFMGYSTRADTHQIGFGVSAISYVGGNYFQNQKELASYYEAIQNSSLATLRGYLLNDDDLIRRDLIMQIMCKGHVDYASFGKRWDIDFRDYFVDELPRLEALAQDGIIEANKRGLRIIGHGFLFLRNVAMAFDSYLAAIQEHSTTPVFSKTV